MEVHRGSRIFFPPTSSHLPLSIVCDIAGTWMQLNLELDVSSVMTGETIPMVIRRLKTSKSCQQEIIWTSDWRGLTEEGENNECVSPAMGKRNIQGNEELVPNFILTVSAGRCIQGVIEVAVKCVYKALGPG